MVDPNVLILRDFQSFWNKRHTHASLKIIDIAMVLQMRNDRCILGFTHTCDINNDKNNRERYTAVTVLISGKVSKMQDAEGRLVIFHSTWFYFKKMTSCIIYVTYKIIHFKKIKPFSKDDEKRKRVSRWMQSLSFLRWGEQAETEAMICTRLPSGFRELSQCFWPPVQSCFYHLLGMESLNVHVMKANSQ